MSFASYEAGTEEEEEVYISVSGYLSNTYRSSNWSDYGYSGAGPGLRVRGAQSMRQSFGLPFCKPNSKDCV